ncbi:keratin, type II cytoskeletal 2 epidermal-like [Iris pallida]|uniref:Keratin, type II cytoskeletal 2 epidermal-like n=1 Tax=Iris pallida TaxID=29817 RepID=A0AAX6DZT2_IRIPA|nr:keratin, type II cytoskeletal 2 epidermal-like [Iris pallida]
MDQHFFLTPTHVHHSHLNFLPFTPSHPHVYPPLLPLFLTHSPIFPLHRA